MKQHRAFNHHRLCLLFIRKIRRCSRLHRKTFAKWVVLIAICYFYYCYRRYMALQRQARNRHRSRYKSATPLRIVFGPSGGVALHQMGFMKALIEHFGTRFFRDQCTFEGMSGGAVAAGYSVTAVHGCHDLDYWLQHATLPFTDARRRCLGALFNAIESIYTASCRYIHEVDRKYNKLQETPPWFKRKRFVVWTSKVNFTHIPMLRSVAYQVTGSLQEFADHLTASTYIPLLLSKWFWYPIDGSKHLDGGFAFFCGDDSIFSAKTAADENSKILYINVDGLWRAFPAKRQQQHCQLLSNGNKIYCFDLGELDKDLRCTHLLPHGGAEQAHKLYQRGYHIAKQNMAQIETVLALFRCDADQA